MAASQRTRAALLARRESGVRLGRPRALPPDVIDRIVAAHERGVSQTAIAADLNADGVPTAQGGARWRQGTIHAILRSVSLDREYCAAATAARYQRQVSLSSVEPARPEEVPVRRSPRRSWGLLPEYVDVFIGRRSELAELEDLLGTSRLLTLLGPEGMGKTRLAVELAVTAAPRYRGGVRFVDLASLTDSHRVPGALAGAIGIREQPGRPLIDAVAAHLRDRRLLLVLDACENLAAACAAVAERLLGDCPGVTIVATSRTPTGARIERLWPVPPLAVPDLGSSADTVAAADAVRLFGERAARVHRGFALTGATAPAVAGICRRLDGAPLAIELAAARASTLAVADIAVRLQRRLSLPAGGACGVGTVSPMRGVIDWSHGLLPPAKQVLFRRLSVFAGGCNLGAVEAVCADSPAARASVLHRLTALVARSLVLADTGGVRARYRLPEAVRAYGIERLAAAGELESCRDRHAAWCLELAEMAEAGLTGPDQQVWADVLEADHDNIRLALAWLVERRQGPLAMRLSSALALFWRRRGHVEEGRRWLGAARAQARDQPAGLHGALLWAVGYLAHVAGDDGAAAVAVAEGLERTRGGDEPRLEGRLLLVDGMVSTGVDPAVALTRLAASAGLARAAGDQWCLATALAFSGRCHLLRGDVESARTAVAEGLGIAREAEDHDTLGVCLELLGDLALAQGHHRSAQAVLEEALGKARAAGDPHATARVLRRLGRASEGRAQYDRAISFLTEAMALGAGTAPGSVVDSLCGLARVALAQGDAGGARRRYDEAMAVAARAGAGACRAALRGLGQVALAELDLSRARQLLGEAVGLDRSARDGRGVAIGLHCLAQLARLEGEATRAASLCHEALEIRHSAGDIGGAAESLEGLAGLAAYAGRWERAARLLGSAAALRGSTGCADLSARWPGHDADVAATREALGSRAFDTVHAQGAALSLDDSVAYAQRGRGPRRRPAVGWASLTPAESEVAELAAQGLTNAQIGERLFISPRTAGRHLHNIYAKLCLTGRTELARELPRRPVPGAPSHLPGPLRGATPGGRAPVDRQYSRA